MTLQTAAASLLLHHLVVCLRAPTQVDWDGEYFHTIESTSTPVTLENTRFTANPIVAPRLPVPQRSVLGAQSSSQPEQQLALVTVVDDAKALEVRHVVGGRHGGIGHLVC